MHTAKFDTFSHDQISLTNFSKTGHTLHQINFIKIGLIKTGIPTHEAKITKIKLKKNEFTTWNFTAKIDNLQNEK